MPARRRGPSPPALPALPVRVVAFSQTSKHPSDPRYSRLKAVAPPGKLAYTSGAPQELALRRRHAAMLKLAAMELAPAPAPSATELKSNGGGKPVANSAGTPGLPLVLGFHMVGLAAVITVLICSGHLEHLHLHGLHGLGETAMVAALLLPTLLNVQQPRLRAALLVAHRLAFLALPQLLGGPAGAGGG